jgi:hypothetical protein
MTNKTQIITLYGILLEAQLDLDNLVEKELKGGRFLLAKSKRGGARKTEVKPEWQKLGDAVLKLNKSEIDRLMKYIGRCQVNLWDNLSQTTHGATSVALFLFRRFNHVCTLHTY